MRAAPSMLLSFSSLSLVHTDACYHTVPGTHGRMLSHCPWYARTHAITLFLVGGSKHKLVVDIPTFSVASMTSQVRSFNLFCYLDDVTSTLRRQHRSHHVLTFLTISVALMTSHPMAPQVRSDGQHHSHHRSSIVQAHVSKVSRTKHSATVGTAPCPIARGPG
jgi:hypothetical protein